MTVQSGASGKYPIRAVSKLTGIGIDTLRAWERRYEAVVPVRDGRGRMYTDGDVARLRLLRDAVERGHSIGRLAVLADEDLRQLATDAGAVKATSSTERGAPEGASANAAVLIEALHQFDMVAIDQEMARLASVLRPLDLLQDVLMPVLAQVGDDWHRGRATIAQEHLLTSAIRHMLGSLLRLHARRQASTRLMFTTPAGDRHEIGTLGAAMLAACSGLGVTYLGPDVPSGDIVAGVKQAGASVLALGLTTTSAREQTERELRAIVRDLPQDVELWAGGGGAEHFAPLLGSRGMVLRDYHAFQRELVRLGGHA